MKYSGWDYLDHMISTCEELFFCMEGITSIEEFESDIKTRRAVTMCLLDLGELFTGLGDEEKNAYKSDAWQRIIGFRNRAAHGYHDLQFDIVYKIVQERVPVVYEFLKQQQQQSQPNL